MVTIKCPRCGKVHELKNGDSRCSKCITFLKGIGRL